MGRGGLFYEVGRWALGVINHRQNPTARVVVLRLTWKASEFEAWKVGRLKIGWSSWNVGRCGCERAEVRSLWLASPLIS
jgi:hypothetical protein